MNTITNQIILHPPVRHFILAILVWIILRCYHQPYLHYLLRWLEKPKNSSNNNDRLRRAKESFRVSRYKYSNNKNNNNSIQQQKKLRKRHRKHDKIKNKMNSNRGDFLMVQSCRPPPVLDSSGDDDGFGVLSIVGIDCEMVGVGRHGQESELARCSIVQRIVTTTSSSSSSERQTFRLFRDDDDDDDDDYDEHKKKSFRILYDKAVRPRRKVVDYRTAYSGITKDILNGNGDLTVVGHDECRREVAELLACVDGRPVLVVGHALDNDFDALRIKHPTSLIRDTATYPPFMRESGRKKNRPLLQRKLSHLLSEELNLNIQSSENGHSSVEDAAAALSLYLKHQDKWEDSLGHPLRLLRRGGDEIDDDDDGGGDGKRSKSSSLYPPLTILLDGCNLPLSVRFPDNDNSNNNYLQAVVNGTSSEQQQQQQQQLPRIISKLHPHGTSSPPSNTNTTTPPPFDWLPIFRTLLYNTSPSIHSIRLIFDGKKYQQTHSNPTSKSKRRQRHPSPGTSTPLGSPQIILEITDENVSADDVIVDHCTRLTPPSPTTTTTTTTPTDMFQRYNNNNTITTHHNNTTTSDDTLFIYHVVRRGSSNTGSKKHSQLLSKLLLSRGYGEGGYCLMGLTRRLVDEGRRVAKLLERKGLGAGGGGGGGGREDNVVVVCEEKRREDVRCVVVTEDVYLRQRVVERGGVVLTYKQLGYLG